MKQKIITIIALSLGLSLLAGSPSLVEAKQKKNCRRQAKPAVVTKPALAVINNPTLAFQSGEVNVAVRGDENPIIRLQMMASGQALVEFPAKDRIFKVNPADPDLVTIEDSPTKEYDRYILLRSSKQFLPPAPGPQSASPATSMLVQMSSGMVITLLVYPVRDLAQVVHRCVVRYDRDAIVGARQAAGLAVNLDHHDPAPQKNVITSFQYTPPLKLNLASSTPQQSLGENAVFPLPELAMKRIDEGENGKTKAPPPTSAAPQARATEIKVKKEAKERTGPWDGWDSGKLRWSKPLHGLKAAAQTRALSAAERQVLVTVRNDLSTPLKIAPGQPELTVQTLDDKGRMLQVEPVKISKVELDQPDGLIAPGEKRRYLISYEAPVLGAKQRLCVSVSQSNAADEPVVVELTTGTR
ncbi:MAG: hypothetical protein ABI977_33050 [Acidobacteriota bacterium]